MLVSKREETRTSLERIQEVRLPQESLPRWAIFHGLTNRAVPVMANLARPFSTGSHTVRVLSWRTLLMVARARQMDPIFFFIFDN